MFLTFPQQQVMAPLTPQQEAIRFQSSQTTGALYNVPPGETQQPHGHQLVLHDTAIIGTKNMTHDMHLKMVPETRSSQSKKQQEIGCE